MTTMLEDIGTYMQSNGRGTLSTDLWLNFTPEQPDSVTVVHEYGSAAPKDTMGAHVAYVESPLIQVMVRRLRTDYISARTEADLVYALLGVVINQTIGGRQYTIIPQQTPFLSGRDGKERVLVSCNYAVTRAG